MPQINNQWIRTKQVQSQKFKYRILEHAEGPLWIGSKKMPRGNEKVKRVWGNEGQRKRQREMIPALMPVFFPSYLFTFLYRLHTSYLNRNRFTQEFQLGQVSANSTIWLCVPTLWDISSISYPQAATRLPASQFRGHMLPSSPFNVAPAANVDWFSPTVATQLSASLPHLWVLCTDYGKVTRWEIYK